MNEEMEHVVQSQPTPIAPPPGFSRPEPLPVFGTNAPVTPLPTYAPTTPVAPLPTYSAAPAPLPTYNPATLPTPVAPVSPVPVSADGTKPVPVTSMPYIQPIPHPSIDMGCKNPIHPVVKKRTDESMNIGIAAAAMAQFPIVSMLSVYLGLKVSKDVKKTEEMAESYKCDLPGKHKIAKILGMVGTIAGLVYSASHFIAFVGFLVYWVLMYIIYI